MPTSLERQAHTKPQEHSPEEQYEQSENEQPKGNDEEDKKPHDPAKSRRFILIGIVAIIVIAAGGFAWWSHSQTYESTDDAEIDGHLNPISSRVAGTVKAVYADNNQPVEAGKLLIDLDTTDYETSQAQAQAQYHQALAQLRSEQPNVPIQMTSNATDLGSAEEEVATASATLAAAEHDYQNSLAQLWQAEANNGKAQNDVLRYKQLIDKHEVAESEYDQYYATAKAQAAAVAAQRAAVDSAGKTIEQRRAQLHEQQIKMEQTRVNAPRQILIRNANIQAQRANAESAAAQLRQDQLNLLYCHIAAPVSGLVSQRTAEVGARISVGQQLMMVVQTSDLWVTANFKETQLKKVHPGQRVTVKVDGLDKSLQAYVESMPASTGDRTSALPPENATGNYVKVVQRMPVRIRFRADQDGLGQLRPGMSVVPKIHF
jgi:membrane fusion protein, multidrug efflux system